jgi:hypothetical protein
MIAGERLRHFRVASEQLCSPRYATMLNCIGASQQSGYGVPAIET